MASTVTVPKTPETTPASIHAPREAGTITMGIMGSQGPRMKTMKSVQVVTTADGFPLPAACGCACSVSRWLCSWV